MLKEQQRLLKGIMVSLDLFVMIVSFLLAYIQKNKLFDAHQLSNHLALFFIMLVFWSGFNYYFGMYRSFITKQMSEVFFIIFKTALATTVLFGSYIFFVKVNSYSRGVIISTLFYAIVFTAVEKVSLLKYLRYRVRSGANTTNILIIGTGKRAQRFMSLIDTHKEWGFKVIGLVDEDTTKINSVICGYKVIGSFKDIPSIIHDNVVDEVFFIVPRSWLNKIENIIYMCEIEGLKVRVAVDLYELKLSKAKYSHLDEFPLLSFESTPDKLLQLLIKRIVDITVSATALILLIPVFIVTAILIKGTSEGPVFFSQQRCSLNGRKFTLYKFRTMVNDAENRLSTLLTFNEMNGPVFKMNNDPRLTKVGRYLRKFSIDELPQLWNVLKGDMSLVGPRPPLPSEVLKYDHWQRRRLSMRPGLTCLWQVYGRNNIVDFNEWMRLDLEYIDNWSLLLDYKILFKTIPAVLFGIGAK